MPLYSSGFPDAPVNSLQFNEAGSFGGDANLNWVAANGLTDKKHSAFGADAVIDTFTGNYALTSLTVNIKESMTVDRSSILVAVGETNFSADSQVYFGSFAELDTKVGNTRNDGSLFVYEALARHLSGSNLDGITGFSGELFNVNAGSVDQIASFFSNIQNTGAGTVTEAFGLYVAQIQNTGGGTLTNSYGVYILDQNQATNSFAIKTFAGLVSFGDDIEMANGQAFGTDTTTAHTALLRAYDVDGAAYKTFATLTNGNTPDFSVVPPAGGTITLQATTYKSSDGTLGATAGPFTTITAIQVKNGLVTTLTGA